MLNASINRFIYLSTLIYTRTTNYVTGPRRHGWTPELQYRNILVMFGDIPCVPDNSCLYPCNAVHHKLHTGLGFGNRHPRIGPFLSLFPSGFSDRPTMPVPSTYPGDKHLGTGPSNEHQDDGVGRK